MSSPSVSSTSSVDFRIDKAFLLRRVFQLEQLKNQRRNWNDMGRQLVDNLDLREPTLRPLDERARPSRITRGMSKWEVAKGLVHEVITCRTPAHDAIRRRMGKLESPSTALLLSTLSLWLAGAMGMSTSTTVPMVAIMLYAVGDASGNWDILVQDKPIN